jgi:hypothetical protein
VCREAFSHAVAALPSAELAGPGQYEGHVQYAAGPRVSLQCFEGRCAGCPDIRPGDAESDDGPLDGYRCDCAACPHGPLDGRPQPEPVPLPVLMRPLCRRRPGRWDTDYLGRRCQGFTVREAAALASGRPCARAAMYAVKFCLYGREIAIVEVPAAGEDGAARFAGKYLTANIYPRWISRPVGQPPASRYSIRLPE